MQVLFVVHGAQQKLIVEQVFAKSPRVECQERLSELGDESHIFKLQNKDFM